MTKGYQKIKSESQEKHNVLFKNTGVFWAFSNEQFEENKTPLKEGEKYVSIGAGGYMPKGNAKALTEGLKSIKKWEAEERKKVRDIAEQEILYELNNYECFYTGDISDAWDILKENYTKKQVIKIYNKHRERIQEEQG